MKIKKNMIWNTALISIVSVIILGAIWLICVYDNFNDDIQNEKEQIL